jgi:nucleotide-binding universal stress UspA family protein
VAAERNARFIVVGSRGEGPVRRALTGSVPHKLLETAEVPVVVVRG